MVLKDAAMTDTTRGRGYSVFLSASIPDPDRWEGPFDVLEITDAVVALARVFLTSGVKIVTAAHPTIAPLLFYVAAELPHEDDDESSVKVYQSQLFEDVLPAATRRFERAGIGRVVWTPAEEGEHPVPGSWDRSLALMRHQMLEETNPSAAVFIGGMSGIPDEFALFRDLFPDRPVYALGRPGGAARSLVDQAPEALRGRLLAGGTYPALWREVLTNLIGAG